MFNVLNIRTCALSNHPGQHPRTNEGTARRVVPYIRVPLIGIPLIGVPLTVMQFLPNVSGTAVIN
jgi:hypothetical protein